MTMTQPTNVCKDPRCMCSCHETPGAKPTRSTNNSFLSMPQPVPKPSQTKKPRGRKSAEAVD